MYVCMYNTCIHAAALQQYILIDIHISHAYIYIYMHTRSVSTYTMTTEFVDCCYRERDVTHTYTTSSCILMQQHLYSKSCTHCQQSALLVCSSIAYLVDCQQDTCQHSTAYLQSYGWPVHSHYSVVHPGLGLHQLLVYTCNSTNSNRT
jgi:hypothetical protein